MNLPPFPLDDPKQRHDPGPEEITNALRVLWQHVQGECPPRQVLRLPMFDGRVVVTVDYEPPLTPKVWDKVLRALGAARDVNTIEPLRSE